MPEERDQLIEHFEGSRVMLLAAIKGLTPALMTEGTIDGWSVKDHLFHLASWDDIRAQEVTRISAGHDSAWRMSQEQDESFNGLSYDLRKELSLAQAEWELQASRDRLLAALRSATTRGLDSSLYGEAGLVSGHEAEHAGWIRLWRERRGI